MCLGNNSLFVISRHMTVADNKNISDGKKLVISELNPALKTKLGNDLNYKWTYHKKNML